MLLQMNDPTAVPALIRAAERYKKDALLLQAIAEALAALKDPRGLQTLRRLSHGHNASLMLTARQAVSDLEERAVLLRSAEKESVPNRILLSPASFGADGGTDHLVWPVQ